MITGDLGFGPYAFVRDRISVADLFKPNRRCGLYALHFANGDGYVGKSVDVVRRFVGHRQNHDDIVEIAFRLVPAPDQDREERAAIAACEVAAVRLRNIQFMSVVLGDADLDTVISRDEQAVWLRSYARTTTFDERPTILRCAAATTGGSRSSRAAASGGRCSLSFRSTPQPACRHRAEPSCRSGR
jgi:hypothetical protein